MVLACGDGGAGPVVRGRTRPRVYEHGQHASEAAPLCNFLRRYCLTFCARSRSSARQQQLRRASAQPRRIPPTAPAHCSCPLLLPTAPAHCSCPLAMAAPGARMRLTVVVEALAEENAVGQYRDMALAAFKERKFAMPVQLEDTFETVWSDIEHRYKTNYLSPQQAATFSIKKLQDAYDCDLDMADTVGAIFEGEPDRRMHLIKVVPHFIYRETSVVPGSMLRPAGAQKRAGDDTDDGTNKRRRIESQQRHSTHVTRDPSPNHPLPSTESQQAADSPVDATGRSVRSRSGMSLLELSRNETGQAPFASNQVKEEFPEPIQPLALNGIDGAAPDALSDAPPVDDELPEPERGSAEGEQTKGTEHTPSVHVDARESAIHKSPVSSVESAPAPSTKTRRDVYHVPSSPEFMHTKAPPEKPANTYGRSPRSGAELLNMARRLGRSTETTGTAQPKSSASTTNKARAFQRTQPDEIESTPRQESGDRSEDLIASFLEKATGPPDHVHTPARKTANKPVKPGSLKKPSRASLVATPASAKRAIKPKAAVTPVSTMTATKSIAKGKKTTPSVANSPKGEKVLGEATMSRMERLEKLLNASQHTPKQRGNDNSPARSESLRSHDRSHKSSPEVRIPVPKKPVSVKADAATMQARTIVQSPSARITPIRSPVPLPPSKNQKSTTAHVPTPESASKVPKPCKPDTFKKPAAKALGSPSLSTPVNKAQALKSTGTPKRSEVPLPPNVRHLRRGSSLQASPLSNGNIATNGNSLSVPRTTSASPNNTTSQSSPNPSNKAATDSAESGFSAKPVIDPIVNSCTESLSLDRSDTDNVEQCEPQMRDVDGIVHGTETPAALQSPDQLDATKQGTDDNVVVTDEVLDRPKQANERNQSETMLAAPSQIGTQPTSGQGSSEAAPMDSRWSFDSLGHTTHARGILQENRSHQAANIAATASDSEDGGLAEQDIYSTAIEDNASRSRSGSADVSLRSSPAISRRPARFLSHSPTPDASDSEGDSDEASPALSRAASPRADDKGSESESDSSSDSSDDDDVKTLNPHAKSIVGTRIHAAPASSPPLTGIMSSTPKISQISQSTTAKNDLPVNRTPTA